MSAEKKKCHCFLFHPSTTEERERVKESLRYSRDVGDTWAIALIVSQLTAYCPTRDGKAA